MLAIGKLHKHSDKAFEQGEEKAEADVQKHAATEGIWLFGAEAWSMQRYLIKPYVYVNDVAFGMSPEEVQRTLGAPPYDFIWMFGGTSLIECYSSLDVCYQDGKCAYVRLQIPAEVVVGDIRLRLENLKQARDEVSRADPSAEVVRCRSRESLVAPSLGLRLYVRDDAADGMPGSVIAFSHGAFEKEFVIRQLAHAFLPSGERERIEEYLFEDEFGVAYEELCAGLAFGDATLAAEQYAALAKVGDELRMSASTYAPICVQDAPPSFWDASRVHPMAEDAIADPTSESAESRIAPFKPALDAEKRK